MQDKLNCVSQIIKDTADIEILPYFNQPESFETFKKSLGEIVTNIDINAERRLTESLLSLSVDSEVIGEESASEDTQIYHVLKKDKPVWIIDPLDGTRNFANGKNCFAIIVALCLGGETVAGWIYDPINLKMYSAYKGVGATLNGKSLNIKECQDLSNMIGSTGQNFSKILDERAGGFGIPKRCNRYRCIGREYGDLATGILDFAEYSILKPWDHAAGVLIHSEAGGYSAFISDKRGYLPVPPVKKTLLIAQSEKVWTQILKILSIEN
tara:strand:+ start:39246 stop:40049 length:804 start_codon:yes stop_codon:yes gene_type:complete